MLRHALVLLALAAPLAAQAKHPDFNGTWVLDPAKSVVDGQIPAPSSETDVIVQTGDSILSTGKSSSEQGEITTRFFGRTDGKSWTNTLGYQGMDLSLQSVLSWNGDVLTIRTTTDVNGTPVDQTMTWTMAPDGKGLTKVTVTNVNGTYFSTVTLVFVKK